MNVWIERKRTTHETRCKVCNKDISKGEFRLVIRSFGYHHQESMYAHPKCLVDWMEHEIIAIYASGKKFIIDGAFNPTRRDE